MTSGPVLELAGIAKSYRSGDGEISVLLDLDLSVATREWVCVMGPSGSGKSTLLGIAGLLVPPDTGRRCLQGRDVTVLDEDDGADLRFDRVGFCFQSFLLSPSLTALENVMLPALPRAVSFDLRARAEDLLRRVGLGERLGHLPSQLSGGEQQRVAVARSLLNDPPLLLVDEPTANLDRDTAAGLADLFSELRGAPRSALIATHDPLMLSVADRVVELADGRLRERPAP